MLTSAIHDEFAGAPGTALWDYHGTAANSGGKLLIDPTVPGASNGIITRSVYDLDQLVFDLDGLPFPNGACGLLLELTTAASMTGESDRLFLRVDQEMPGAANTGHTGTPTALTAANRPYLADIISGTTLSVNTNGAVYTGWKFNHQVDVKASGVVFDNCWFAGSATAGIPALLRVETGAGRSATATSCTMSPAFPNNSTDGVRGSNLTLLRCDINGTVDGGQIYGSLSNRSDPYAGNILVADCWVHDMVFYANDPGGRPEGTHNDGFQISGGRNIEFRGNTFSGEQRNAVWMVTQASNPISDLRILGNFIDATAASGLNLNDTPGTGPVTGLRMVGNMFTKTNQTYPILVTLRTINSGGPVVSGNVWHDGSTPPPAIRPGG